MRLLYVIPGLGGGGGAERSLAAMAPVWAEGHDVHIVTFSDRRGLSGALRDAGATLHELGAVSTPRLLRSLVHIARTTRPDLIHTTLFHADVAGRLTAAITGTVVSSSLVNVNYGAAQRTTPGQSPHTLRGARLVDAASAQVVSRFHALSTHVADEMAPLLHVDRSLIDVIPRGRDGAALGRRNESRRAAVRERLGLPADAPVVGLAARHEWQKGVDRFVDALPALVGTLPDVHVIMAGRDGALSAEIRRRLPEAMPASQLLDLGPRDDVADLMCAADVWCVPSRWEGLGSILVEAMALGYRPSHPTSHRYASSPARRRGFAWWIPATRGSWLRRSPAPPAPRRRATRQGGPRSVRSASRPGSRRGRSPSAWSSSSNGRPRGRGRVSGWRR
ncbi:MAG: glycosyltransferase family 4 protein [Actinobacteria bacterium]|nr:glycosyltransferase family 4 protein [Actinomycetota bacterium]